MYVFHYLIAPVKKFQNPSYAISFLWQSGSDDFEFDNEIRKPRVKSEQPGSESDFARGSVSDNDSLLERKEVLAGMYYIKPTLFQYYVLVF